MASLRSSTLVGLLALVFALAAAAPAAAQSGGVGVEASLDARVSAPSVDALPEAPSAPSVDAWPHDVLVPLASDVSLDAGVGAEASLEASARGAGDGGASSSDESSSSSEVGALARAVVDAVPPEVAEAAPPVVAAAGLMAVLQALGAWRVLGLGAFAMYSRLTKSDMLDNTHRERVFHLIRDSPGLGVSEISQRTGLGWGTTVYHLDRLERAQMVTSERAGAHRCYFPVGAVAREERKAIGALKQDTTRSVAEFLVARPGATQTELCDALGMSASAASKHISKLESAGLVRREREWKTVRVFPEEPLRQVAAPSSSTSPAVAAGAPALVPVPA